MKHTGKFLLGSSLVLSAVVLASCGKTEQKTYIKQETAGTTVYFGKFAQTKVSEEEVTSLGLTSSKDNESKNEIVTVGDTSYYKVASAAPNADGQYKASTGETLVSGETYWFKMEDIAWRVLADDGSNYTLISENVIASSAVYYSVPRLFEDNRTGYDVGSTNRRLARYLTATTTTNRTAAGWLTQVGLDSENKYIDRTKLQSITYTQTVIESDSSKSSQNAVAITLSEEELNSYESTNSQTKRIAQTTDFARATGAWMSIEEEIYGYGIYWLRDTSTTTASDGTPCYNGMFKVVNEQGEIKEDYGFNTFGGVRPVIKVAKSDVTTK